MIQLDIRIPPEVIVKLLKLKDKKSGVPPRMITDHPSSDPTSDSKYNSTSTLASSPPKPPQSPMCKLWSGPLPEDRLFEIFPSGLESKSSITASPFIFTPMYISETLRRPMNKQHAGHTVVTSAWYGKQTKSAKHEFIMVHVEDLAKPGLRNCIVIDRNKSERGGSSPIATDAFRVSYDGDMKRLLKESKLTPYMMLETITFQPGKPLLLPQLVDLVRHVSEQHKKYNPVDKNCYWFAGMIWECIRGMYTEVEHEVLIQGRRGRISYARFSPSSTQVTEVIWAIQSGASASKLEASSSNNLVNEPEKNDGNSSSN